MSRRLSTLAAMAALAAACAMPAYAEEPAAVPTTATPKLKESKATGGPLGRGRAGADADAGAAGGSGAEAAVAAAKRTAPGESTLYVYSTIDALLSGAYDGDLTVGQLATHGDFGIGTYNHLDGEMILLGGVSYHARADGSISVAPPTDKVPLAYVLPFHPDQHFELADGAGGRTLTELEAALAPKLGGANFFQAVQVHGEFADINTRAIAAQVRPYKPLAELVKTQSVFPRESVTGTLVGLRSPAFSKGISVPGWHWHFVSDDHRYGGHVLALRLVKGEVQTQTVHAMALDLPATDDFAQADQARDRAVELKQVEGDRKGDHVQKP